METDRPLVAPGQGRADGRPAGRAVRGAQRFEAPGAVTFGENGVGSVQHPRHFPQQPRRYEGHIPRDTNHANGRLSVCPSVRPTDRLDRRQYAPERSLTLDNVPVHDQPRPPARGIGRVRDQQRRRAGGLGERVHDAIEYPPAADLDEALGGAAVSCRAAAGDDRAADVQ